jgi:threonine dehydratase
MAMEIVTPMDILQARRRLTGVVWTTPCVQSEWLSERLGGDVFLKLENLQRTGSFKLRGALNKLKVLDSAGHPKRVLTVSAGNHGRAIAYGAELLGFDATVIIPRSAPITKIEAIKRHRVQLQLIGENYDEAEQAARQMASDENIPFISPYNDPQVIAGQGTVGLEMLEAVPTLETLLVPVGGGGLLAGIALIAKALNPRIKVIGVQSENSPAMYESFAAGRIAEVVEKETIADGLAGNIEKGSVTFPIIQQWVDEIILVTEEDIAQAMLALLEHEHLVVEGAGAVGVAALLSKKSGVFDAPVGVVVSGGNVDTALVKEIMAKYGESSER